ncbi:serine threonine protein kinase : Serine/threonine protein kinase OS=Singulisphaera acidiphila (strain ATCC BAA-1392 / DSM 18658 / VKM B-2454 / MOB10) GN=Sinac_2382 PE=4 SV=1: Pkinase: TPR_16 [Gemmataceae bacterium]|nr:serine threonine protein kinase : Serine/threonine protein kinase OS=Singulisphaera acidiphila (strain ATCC BAA-1392 / DSM 18658 / VKM B-2454 / MOB10) GN=Sinac_2382 PE=4 SV=1: Pkinase: TPR_16 [Gemmataceae bacterium]VTU02184.1 serine threonine protein kinase : Serine/threonine protein kinase OS=Singulisphaera acidiphila (strain ATCC BAA-1392 / DSM 18658 / VKM B-2454 / MOB10) GN=Sinac_2382 PE=4 SV=1: Pkinase: TPR_16 [Gemmataceae bacterium]
MDPDDLPTTVNRPPHRTHLTGPLASSNIHAPAGGGCGPAAPPPPPAPHDFPAVGDTLDHCVLVAELGRGGSGSAFLARQPALADRPLVLKVSRNPSRHEDLNLARLQHTHIMPLYWATTVEATGLRVLAMPYLARTTLGTLVQRLGDRPVRDWTGAGALRVLERDQDGVPVRIAAQPHAAEALGRASWVEFVVRAGEAIAEALAYAHERGLVHLDLKPANVLVTPDGHPIVLDLDVARQPIAANTPSVPWLGGTWLYMSPEQRAAITALSELDPIPQAVDGRSDLYSLGLILAAALAGTPGDEPPPDPRDLPRLNPGVSRGLAAVVAKCLAPDPGDRYPTGTALAEDLNRHLNDLPLRGVRDAPAERWRKWRRRRPLGLPLAVLLAAFCAAACAAGLTAYQRNEDRRREVEVALHDGLEYQRLGQYEAAVGRFLAGADLAERTLGADAVGAELAARVRQARQRQLAVELDAVVGQLRFYALQDHTPRRLQWVLEGAGRKLWAERRALLDRSGGPLEPAVEAAIRDRLLELVVLWTDLLARIAPPPHAGTARDEVREVLAEAERVFGPSLGLWLARERHGEGRAGPRPEPGAAWEFCALARAALDRGDAAAAVAFCEAATDRDPLGFVPNYYLGVCLLKAGKYDRAARVLSLCVGQNPGAECLVLRGRALAGLGEPERALADFTLAVERSPELGVAYLARSQALRQLGRTREADADEKTARSLGE